MPRDNKANIPKPLPDSISALLQHSSKIIDDSSERVELVLSLSLSPLGKLGEEMHQFFNHSMVGQDEAKRKISRIVSMIPLRERQSKKGTIANLLLVGPSGVGKSTIPKLIADFLLGSPDALTRIDGGTLKSDSILNTLLGSPPGYNGHDNIPILSSTILFSHFQTSKTNGEIHPLIKNMPSFGIILIDEVDRVNKSIIEALYAMMDENGITLNTGELVKTQNILLICTTNLGQKEYQNFMNNGVDRKRFQENPNAARNKMRETGNSAIQKHFESGFLSRVEIVHFDELSLSEVHLMIEKELRKISFIYHGENTKITFHEGINSDLYRFYDPQTGIRPIIKIIQNQIIPLIERYKNGEESQLYMDLPRGTEIHIYQSGQEFLGKISIDSSVSFYVQNDFEKTLELLSRFNPEQKNDFLFRLLLSSAAENNAIPEKYISYSKELFSGDSAEVSILNGIFSGNKHRIEYLLRKSGIYDGSILLSSPDWQNFFGEVCSLFFMSFNESNTRKKDQLKQGVAKVFFLPSLDISLDKIFEEIYNTEATKQ